MSIIFEDKHYMHIIIPCLVNDDYSLNFFCAFKKVSFNLNHFLMFGLLLGARSAKATTMSCSLIDNQHTLYANAGYINFTCTGINNTESLVAKLGPYSATAADYTFNATNTTGNWSITYTETNVTYSKVTLAVNSSGTISKYSEVDVTVLANPTLSALSRVDSTNPIYPTSELKFKTTISTTVVPTSPKIMYALCNTSLTCTNFEGLDPVEVNLTANNGEYTFPVKVPETTKAGEYKVIAQYMDQVNQTSNNATSNVNITVAAPKIECSAADGKVSFAYNSSAVEAKCTVYGSTSKTFKAKVNGTSTTESDYTNICNITSSGSLTCNFSNNTEDAESISIAVINASEVKAATEVKLNLVTPTNASDLAFVGKMPKRIYRGDKLHFNLTVSSPTVTEVSGKAQLGDAPLTAFTSDAVTVKLTKAESNVRTFDYVVPDTASYANHTLTFQVTNLIGQSSEMLYINFTVIEKPKFDCVIQGSKYLKASGNITLKCDVAEQLKNLSYLISFNESVYFGNTTLNNSMVSFSYENQTTEVPMIYVGAFLADDDMVVHSGIDASIFPEPAIANVVDTADNTTMYIVGNEIKLNITKERFYLLENATIKYAFLKEMNATASTMITATSQPVKSATNDNEYFLKVVVPESEKDEGKRYIKLMFTDLAEQSTEFITNTTISLRRTVFMTESKIEHADSSSSEEPKYKKGETIKITFTLTNLESDWQSKVQFGYVFGDKDGNLTMVENFTVVKSSARKAMDDSTQTVSLNIKIPEDYEIPADGNTTLYVYTLDKQGNKISPPLSQQITFDTTTGSDTTPSNKGLSGGAIAGIVIAVIAVIAGSVAGVFFFMKNRKGKVSGEVMP